MTITLRSKLASRTHREGMPLSHLLFLLFWLTKPFYFRYPGLPEPADYLLVLAFGVWLAQKHGVLPFRANNKWLLLFIGALSVCNISYWFVYNDTVFLYATAYFFYSLMLIVMFADLMSLLPFKKALFWASLFNIVFQLLVLRSGRGRMYWDIRFMGTFTDPNQFSFSMFSSFLIIYILSFHIPFKHPLLRFGTVFFAYLLMFYLVVKSSSTGIFSGVFSFAVLYAIYFVFHKRTPGHIILRWVFACVAAALLLFFLMNELTDLLASSDNFMAQRIFEKIQKFSNGGLGGIFIERGADKLINYPQYLFYGAGDGAYARFFNSTFEIHSSFLALIFYYGLLPFTAFVAWLSSTLRRPASAMLPPLLALFVESFFLINFRQPAFWMIILLSGAVSLRRSAHSSLEEATP